MVSPLGRPENNAHFLLVILVPPLAGGAEALAGVEEVEDAPAALGTLWVELAYHDA